MCTACLQQLSLINGADEVLKSEYYVTDGVDSLNFASVNGKQDAIVKIRIKGRDVVHSEHEYNAKVQGSADSCYFSLRKRYYE